jgi:hypothetical protein
VRSPADVLALIVHAKFAVKIALLAAAGGALLLCGGSFFGVAVGSVALSEGQWRAALDAVVDAPGDTIDPALDGALVRVVGEATAEAPARDGAFAFEHPDAVALLRVVETFQWIEAEETSRSGVGRGARTTRTKVYHTDWSPTLIDHRTFARPEGHENPAAVPHSDLLVLADGARVGAYTLTAEVVHALPELDPVALTATAAVAAGGQLHGGHIHLHATPDRPAIGDQRISYRALPPRLLTVMAMQDAGQLRPWPQPPSPPLVLAQPGEVSASALVWAERRGSLEAGGGLAILGSFICAFAAVPLFMAGAIAFVISQVRRLAQRATASGG